jgi:hypothetical protein
MRRPPIFRGWWHDTMTGHRTRRASRRELAEATRLWWRFKSIRESKPRSTLRAK